MGKVVVTVLLSAALVITGRPAAISAEQDFMTAARPADVFAGPPLAIRVNVNSVVLNTSVRDRTSNRSISGLEADDFRVYEDGVLQQLQQARMTDAPFNLLLLMDVSGSTYTFTKLMKRAATDFLYEIGQNDRVAVAGFNSKTRLVQDFTSDLEAAADAISRLHSGGGTAFYDALLTSVDKYLPRVEGRKAVVVFTDGVDNLLQGERRDGSRTSFEELSSRLQEADALIYTIFLNSRGKEIMPSSGSSGKPVGRRIPGIGRLPLPLPLPNPTQSRFPLPLPKPKAGPDARTRARPQQDASAAYETAQEQLEEIARLTGGRSYTPGQVQELSGAYAEIADDLRVQYLLSYASSNTNQKDGWRTIRVVVKDHPEAVVRTRRGYTVTLHKNQ